MESLITDTSFRYVTCAQVNPKGGRKIAQGIWAGGNGPRQHLEFDLKSDLLIFAIIIFLVFVDTLEWVEATQTETVPIAIKKLLQEIIP